LGSAGWLAQERVDRSALPFVRARQCQMFGGEPASTTSGGGK